MLESVSAGQSVDNWIAFTLQSILLPKTHMVNFMDL
jgi:hypothetical protein